MDCTPVLWQYLDLGGEQQLHLMKGLLGLFWIFIITMHGGLSVQEPLRALPQADMLVLM